MTKWVEVLLEGGISLKSEFYRVYILLGSRVHPDGE